MSYEYEFIEGILKYDPESKYTLSGKFLSKVKLETSNDENIIVVGWEELGETLNELEQDDKIIVKGYRKLNEFMKKEEFIITQFIKREKQQ